MSVISAKVALKMRRIMDGIIIASNKVPSWGIYFWTSSNDVTYPKNDNALICAAVKVLWECISR
jgi:hypothetical protein